MKEGKDFLAFSLLKSLTLITAGSICFLMISGVLPELLRWKLLSPRLQISKYRLGLGCSWGD